MTKDDLRFIADALLALCEPDPLQPFYSEESFDHKIKLARIREPRAAGLLLEKHGDSALVAQECEDLLQTARLTIRQTEVLHLRLEGHTFEEIGRAGNHSKQGAQKIFVQALKKLQRASSVYRYEGLGDVYRQETRRGLRSRPYGRIL